MVKTFRAGDVVIDGSEPFVIQIDDKERDSKCHYCFQDWYVFASFTYFS